MHILIMNKYIHYDMPPTPTPTILGHHQYGHDHNLQHEAPIPSPPCAYPPFPWTSFP